MLLISAKCIEIFCLLVPLDPAAKVPDTVGEKNGWKIYKAKDTRKAGFVEHHKSFAMIFQELHANRNMHTGTECHNILTCHNILIKSTDWEQSHLMECKA